MECVYAYAKLKKQAIENEWVVPQCPHCGAEHYHGAGPSVAGARQFLGHRTSNCSAAKVPDHMQRHYWLTEERDLHGTSFVIALKRKK